MDVASGASWPSSIAAQYQLDVRDGRLRQQPVNVKSLLLASLDVEIEGGHQNEVRIDSPRHVYIMQHRCERSQVRAAK
jgi:hypothetical protein